MSLLERFTDEARSALVVAQDEARALGHGYIGTEHVLIAILGSGDTPALDEARRQGATPDPARERAEEVFNTTEGATRYVSNEDALTAAGVDVQEVRRRAEAQFGPGVVTMRMGSPPFTPRARDVLHNAVGLAGADGMVTVDHVLLGILDDPECVAAAFLRDVCQDLDGVVSRAEAGRSG